MLSRGRRRGAAFASEWFCGLTLAFACGAVSANDETAPTAESPPVEQPTVSTSPLEPAPVAPPASSEPETLPGQPDSRSVVSASIKSESPVRNAWSDNTSGVSEDAGYAAHWVIDNADNRGQPFAVIDKRGAHLYVFSPNGKLSGDSAILLGLTTGDRSIPGIASRAPASLAPGERTTPAGRFESEPGHNNKGEDIVWFDYDASLAIHRLRPAPAGEHRADRLASANTEDKRISYGCIVVPVAFYDSVVSPALGRGRGVVYVLPETRPARELFGSIELSRR